MGNFLHKETKKYLKSVPPNELPEPIEDYISQPDLSAVEGVPPKHWKIDGDDISEMEQQDKDDVDTGILENMRDIAIDAMVDDKEGDLRQLIRLVISELNILRALHGLPDRTMAEFKTWIYNGYGN